MGRDRIAVSTGSARFAVTRGGTVDTGMPLHEFSREGIEALYFDHDRGRDGLAYDFRRP